MATNSTIQELEALRKKCLSYNKVIRTIGMTYIIGFLLALFGGGIGDMVPQIAALTILLAFFISLFLQKKVKTYEDKFKTLYKAEVVRDILNEELENVEYIEEQGFSKETVDNFRLVRAGNRFSSEDYLSARYKNVEFEQSDVHIQDRFNKSTTEYFRGRMLCMAFPEKQVKSVAIFSRDFHYIGWGAPGMTKLVKTEDVEFNQMCEVTTLDEQEAFYLLTPSFMETVKKLVNKYPSVALHFTGDNLYIAINMERNSFDCTMKQEIQYESERAKIQADIQDIKDVIDTLELTITA